MKIVLIGGGSFVFAPTVLEDALVKHKLADGELVLVDLNAETAEAMAAAGRRIAKETGAGIQITSTTDRKSVLAGADYVIVSASPQGAKRWLVDYEILSKAGMADQARECGGLGGMLNTFRSNAMMLDICRDMEALCPNAILLDVTNPMPRVVTLINKYTQIKGFGFCSIAYRGAEGYEFLPYLLGKKREEVEIVTAGLNHFAWLVSIKEKESGRDLMPDILERVREGGRTGDSDDDLRELKVMKRWLGTYGAIAAGSVDHHAEYLPLQEDIHYTTTAPYHGTEVERVHRMDEICRIGSGTLEWEKLFNHPSWEHPVDVALALSSKQDIRFDILNLPNTGCLPGIPDGRIVEVPVRMRNGEVQGIPVNGLSAEILELCRTLSDVHELVTEAGVKGDILLAERAVELDPAISNKEKAILVLHEMLQAHKDLLPQFQ
ncbi:MAG: hypothetical protein H7X86_11230 [Gorillibacterium sp.]|nr:hypothetical protein [Gorillibacterium sp.]